MNPNDQWKKGTGSKPRKAAKPPESTSEGSGHNPPTLLFATNGFAPRLRFGLVWILFLLATTAAAQDIVHVRSNSGGTVKVRGRVVDYSGNGLRMQIFGSREKTFAVDEVLEIETSYTRNQELADQGFAAGEFEQALALYRKALQEEPRQWVRLMIISQMVRCYQSLDQPVPAGETFLLLIRSDPKTPYLDCIPLAWITRQPPPALEQSALQWVRREEPAAQLLGASYLLAGQYRKPALDRLKQLSVEAEGPIAKLALAQTWRGEVVTVDENRLNSWQGTIESMPDQLTAGPYYVLGLGWAHLQKWEQSALAMMRVPILHPGKRTLAAEALFESGQALEKTERTKQATRLYREVVRDYPKTRAAAEAKARLTELGGE